jgi:hypothetical protein
MEDSSRPWTTRRKFLIGASGAAGLATYLRGVTVPPALAAASAPIVLRQDGPQWEEIPAVNDRGGVDIDTLGLISHDVQVVKFWGYTYYTPTPGLYRFMAPLERTRNLIVFPGDSPIPLLCAVSNLLYHGNRHDGSSFDTLRTMLLTEPWVSVTCGDAAMFGWWILDSEGYDSHYFMTLTNETPNHYDDSHCMLEVLDPTQGWVLVDLDLGYMFQLNGKYLDGRGLVAAVNANVMPELVPIAKKIATLDPNFVWRNGYNFAIEGLWRLSSPERAWGWYKRVSQRMKP